MQKGNPLGNFDPESTAKLVVDILEEMASPGYWARECERMKRIFTPSHIDTAHSQTAAMITKVEGGLQ